MKFSALFLLIFIPFFFTTLPSKSENRRLGKTGKHDINTGKSYPMTPCYCTYESLGDGEHQIDFAVDFSNGLIMTVKYTNKLENGDYVYKVLNKLSFDGLLQPENEYVLSDKPLREANHIAFKSMSGKWQGWMVEKQYHSECKPNTVISKPTKEIKNDTPTKPALSKKNKENNYEKKWEERTNKKFRALNNEYPSSSDSVKHVNRLFEWWARGLQQPFQEKGWYHKETESVTIALSRYYESTSLVDSLMSVIAIGSNLSKAVPVCDSTNSDDKLKAALDYYLYYKQLFPKSDSLNNTKETLQ